jgi:hypothetical protein
MSPKHATLILDQVAIDRIKEIAIKQFIDEKPVDLITRHILALQDYLISKGVNPNFQVKK